MSGKAYEKREKTAVNLYPMALDLRGRRCVIVGGGAVAARKAEGFLEAGASVTIIAPEFSPAVCALRESAGVALIAARFSPVSLDGAFLVVAATDDAAVNEAIGVAARERGILLNQAAEANSGSAGSDFVTMATVRRGDLLVAVTTGGAGPALAARLRRELEERFGLEWAEYVALLREMRDLAKTRWSDDARARTVALRRLAEADGVRVALQNGDSDGARREAMACLF